MTALHANLPEHRPPVKLHDRAADNLAFIRQTMLRASAFTAVPGWGIVAMGVIASAGAYGAALRLSPDWWIWAWIAVATAGCLVGAATTVWKGLRMDQPIWTGAGRRAIFSFCPAILAGMMVTEMFYQHHLEILLPGMWLMLYGVAVCAAGAFSVRVVPLMGLVFMLLGAVAFLTRHDTAPILGPLTMADAILAAGFGGIHILFGLVIAWRHGG